MNPLKQTAVILSLAISPAAFADVVSINGNLNTSDFLATEDWTPFDPIDSWTFYYDVYNFTSADGADINVSMASSDFTLWFAVWDAIYLPDPIWVTIDDNSNIVKSLYDLSIEIGSADGVDPSVSTTIVAPTAGQTYQLAIATFNYNPTDIGDYELEFSSTSDITVSGVPEPSTFVLLGLGLAGIGFGRRRARQTG